MIDTISGGGEYPMGPHRVPRIGCGRCGQEHHIDATTGEFLGRCSNCYGFLRRPTEAERKKFYAFMAWKSQYVGRDGGHGE